MIVYLQIYQVYYNLLLNVAWLVIKDLYIRRWKRDLSGAVITKDGKPVLEFVAIKRKDCDEWAIPGVSYYGKRLP